MGCTRRRLLFLTLILLALGCLGWAWSMAASQARRRSALDLYQAGKFLKAEPRLRAYLVGHPGDADVLRALAKGYAAHGTKGETEGILTQWVEYAPHDTEPLQLRMELNRELGQTDKAVQDLDRLIALEPRNPAWQRKRPGFLFSAGRFEEAEKDCQRSLRAQPGDLSMLRLLAEIKRAQGDLTQAGAILDGILRDAPRDTATLLARANLYHRQDEPEKAIPLFRKVLELDPTRQRTARYHLSLALARTGQTEEAKRLLDEVRRMQDAELLLKDSATQPDNLPLQVRAARALAANNNLPQAVEILQHVLRVDAGNAPAHALLADILEQQGLGAQAAEHRRLAKGTP